MPDDGAQMSWSAHQPLNGRQWARTRATSCVNAGSFANRSNDDRNSANWPMIWKTTSHVRIALSPFGSDDFDRLISWLATEDDLVAWCAGFFRYPLTHAQLEQYLESSKQPTLA
jgi:hypothetical protein